MRLVCSELVYPVQVDALSVMPLIERGIRKNGTGTANPELFLEERYVLCCTFAFEELFLNALVAIFHT